MVWGFVWGGGGADFLCFLVSKRAGQGFCSLRAEAWQRHPAPLAGAEVPVLQLREFRGSKKNPSTWGRSRFPLFIQQLQSLLRQPVVPSRPLAAPPLG